MSVDELSTEERRGIAAFVRRYPQVHMAIGLLGNALFLAGSLLFLVKEQDIGVYAFVVGSSGMFLGSLGELVRRMGSHRLARFDIDPRSPG